MFTTATNLGLTTIKRSGRTHQVIDRRRWCKAPAFPKDRFDWALARIWDEKRKNYFTYFIFHLFSLIFAYFRLFSLIFAYFRA
jgi:hypothetical protein